MFENMYCRARPRIRSSLSTECQDLILQCLKVDLNIWHFVILKRKNLKSEKVCPSERLSVDSILSHPWLQVDGEYLTFIECFSISGGTKP